MLKSEKSLCHKNECVIGEKFLDAIKINILDQFGFDPSENFDKDSGLMREWLCVGPLRFFQIQNFEDNEENQEFSEEKYDDILQER